MQTGQGLKYRELVRQADLSSRAIKLIYLADLSCWLYGPKQTNLNLQTGLRSIGCSVVEKSRFSDRGWWLHPPPALARGKVGVKAGSLLFQGWGVGWVGGVEEKRIKPSQLSTKFKLKLMLKLSLAKAERETDSLLFQGWVVVWKKRE